MMKNTYKNELEFELDLVNLLKKEKGWSGEVLKHPTEEGLIKNWADKLYKNNNQTDKLGDYPLTKTEMNQIINQINKLKTPFNLNGFINGGSVQITRDNPNDKTHLGKPIHLKIYDKNEIAGGKSTYQIARQPIFNKKSQYLPDRRGDLMLLINGMPVIHIELKRSGIPVSQAQNQIQKYSNEGLFTGIFSLIQVFVAMTPEETTYFANPGTDGIFNKRFYFHWENFANEIINDWRMIADQFLSIPMAHQLIGFYTVADNTDNTLKVLRSYQYYAANKISDIVTKTSQNGRENKKDGRGGYVWHTTGSGKTLTSFKASQLIANSGFADKVVFLMDRVELGIQTYEDYKNFSVVGGEEVQSTENTDILRSYLKDNETTLIVTSIQKMSRIKANDATIKNDLEIIRKKKLVIVVDECHRSVFGRMLQDIVDSFPNALRFGFTGTPIYEINSKKGNTTLDVFGNELHRYSIADAIRDKNVLGFDPYKVETFKEEDLRREIALEKSKAKTLEEAFLNNQKQKIFYKYMEKVPMASLDGECIENHIPISQYKNRKHHRAVCEHILDNWIITSRNFKFHAILATSSISEACDYYRLFKKIMNDPTYKSQKLNITVLFDPNTDNDGDDIVKEKALIEILDDYYNMFKTKFSVSTYGAFKKDVSSRLSHKRPYRFVKHETNDTIDLLIVVNQMLTGFDSKWVNALYLDKYLEYENIVQAFSRTNRLCDNDKPNGLIYYYRKPNLMELNITKAIEEYSGNKSYGIFVEKLNENLKTINNLYDQIKSIFDRNGIANFSSAPQNQIDASKFILDFNNLSHTIETAKVQGFRWSKLSYEFSNETILVSFDENIFETLRNRYKELYDLILKNSTDELNQIPPYDIDPSLTIINTDKINYDYIEKNFKIYVKEIQLFGPNGEKAANVLNQVRKSFATLSQEDQKFANIIINDIQSGELIVKEDDNLVDLINEYKTSERDKNIAIFCEEYLIPELDFRNFLEQRAALSNINQYGLFDELIGRCDIQRLAKRLNVKPIKANMILRAKTEHFIESGCLDL